MLSDFHGSQKGGTHSGPSFSIGGCPPTADDSYLSLAIPVNYVVHNRPSQSQVTTAAVTLGFLSQKE